jgi:hypothetical protein
VRGKRQVNIYEGNGWKGRDKGEKGEGWRGREGGGGGLQTPIIRDSKYIKKWPALVGSADLGMIWTLGGRQG